MELLLRAYFSPPPRKIVVFSHEIALVYLLIKVQHFYPQVTQFEVSFMSVWVVLQHGN